MHHKREIYGAIYSKDKGNNMEVAMEKEKKKYGKYENYEIEDLAREYVRLEECRKDPEKMECVMKCLEEKKKEKKSEISSIEDLLKAGEAKRMEDKEE